MEKHFKRTFMTLCLAALLMPGMTHAQKTGYVPAPENLKARKEFSDNKFGIFLHWGIYSLFGQGEWYLNSGGLNCHEYAKAASAFYPSRFNASEWVKAIKEAGIYASQHVTTTASRCSTQNIPTITLLTPRPSDAT
jgi:alpha-L-fucosidase